MRNVLEVDGGDGCTTMSMCSIITLQNGQNGKFYPKALYHDNKKMV